MRELRTWSLWRRKKSISLLSLTIYSHFDAGTIAIPLAMYEPTHISFPI